MTSTRLGFKHLTCLVLASVCLTAGCATPNRAQPKAYENTRRYLLGEHTVSLWELRSRADKAQGLFGYKELPADQGAIFVYDNPTTAAFTMEGMVMRLDIGFFDAQDALIRVANDAAPGARDIHPDGAFQAVVEMRPGTFAANRWTPGTVLYDITEVPPACVNVLRQGAPPATAPGAPLELHTKMGPGFSRPQRALVACAARLASLAVASKAWQDGVAGRSYCTVEDRAAPRLTKGEELLKQVLQYARSQQQPVTLSGHRWNFRLPRQDTNAEREGYDLQLRRYYVNESRKDIVNLATTIVHEWLHVLGFDDPSAQALKLRSSAECLTTSGRPVSKYEWTHASVVYGTEQDTKAAVTALLRSFEPSPAR